MNKRCEGRRIHGKRVCDTMRDYEYSNVEEEKMSRK